MKTLTVRIQSLQDMGSALIHTMKSGVFEQSAGLSFPSYEVMHRILSPKRLDIVRAMSGQGILPYREVARRVGRDFKGVHTDLTALVQAGVIDRESDGVVFPYETIHFDFDIKADAA